MKLPLIGDPVQLPKRLLDEVVRQAYPVKVFTQAGFVRPMRPDHVARLLIELRRWGNTPAAAFSISAIIRGDDPAIIDEQGPVSFVDVDRRSNALASSLKEAGIGPGDNVGVMCRNHRGFIESIVALSKLGANTLLLNTGFAGPQLADVCEREETAALIYDAEFSDLLKGAIKGRRRFVAWTDRGDRGSEPGLDEMIEGGSTDALTPPRDPGRVVILTSGTTGTPKGAGRAQPKNLDPAVSLLSVIPLHAGETTLIAAPLFHSWGFAHFTMGLLLESTIVLQRKFDPEATLAAIAEHRPTVLAVVPVMLQRIMALPEKTRRKYDTSSLRVVAASGSALPGELATQFMDEFGDILYNLYGSTEVAWATIATPADLRAAPGTAGRPPWATTVRLFDEHNKPVEGGETGRIFASSGFEFEGYTGGGHKAQIGGLMSTGDVGRFDSDGRLFVEGRDDEMIVSGGENVFPREIEDLISNRPDVDEVAIIGVKDPEFGQRLKAFIVPKGSKKPSEDEIKKYVRSNTARYKVPREVVFLKELPRNTTGKVLKRELVEQEESGKNGTGGARKAPPTGRRATSTKRRPAAKTASKPRAAAKSGARRRRAG
jgi:acyl-CoA synthetase (AMP-forming)/AMP-acid ligase II